MSGQIYWGENGTQRISLVQFLFDISHVLIVGFNLYFWCSKQSSLSSHAMSLLQMYTFISYKLVTQQVKNEKCKVR